MTTSIRNSIYGKRGQGVAVFWGMVVGGVLWIIAGYLRYMTPLGPDVMYREDLGFSQIISAQLFLLYNIPGVLALLLTAWAALSYLSMPQSALIGMKRAAKVFVLLAFLLALVAATGQVIRFDPLTTGGLRTGLPILGLALLLAGLSVARESNGQEGHQRFLGLELILLGVIGMATLPVGTIIYAFALLPLEFGSALYATFGTGSIVVGFSLHKDMAENAGSVRG